MGKVNLSELRERATDLGVVRMIGQIKKSQRTEGERMAERSILAKYGLKAKRLTGEFQ